MIPLALTFWFAEAGPCGLCGAPDKRHRLWDVLIASPETDETLAWCYNYSVAAIHAVRTVARVFA